MKYIIELYQFLMHVVESRSLLITLIYNNFKQQYLGSYLGLLWAFVQPMVFILVIWFVFDVGFRSGPVDSGAPFFLWLICGMIPWFFIADAIQSGTSAVTSNKFLVKKVAFRVGVLPIVPIGSSLIIHAVLFMMLIIAFLLYGYKPTIYWLQIPYFVFSSIMIVLGLSWLTSALRVFVKDIGNLVGVILQIGFWATPIFWASNIIPEKYRFIVELNPMAYIINGYRAALIEQVWFFGGGMFTTYYFWGVTAIILLGGIIVFKRLRPHFGDVL
ncbi:ABC transporter permease [Vibrio scophthalmi]|uniref:ABC transporter permease n=1 Tax=Vibrio scophthalmi TaxID=45658 RepID=UPI003EC076DD